MTFFNRCVYVNTLIVELLVHVSNEEGLTFARLLTTFDCWCISRLGELQGRVERFLVNLED